MRARFIVIAAIFAAFIAAAAVEAATSPQIPFPSTSIPKFVQPLPLLSVSPQNGTIKTVPGNISLTLRMCEFRANLLPANTVPGYAGTWVWGYLYDTFGNAGCQQLVAQYSNGTGVVDTFTGPVIVSQRNGGPTDVRYINELGNASTTNVLAYKYSTDQTLHWADPLAPWPSANLCMVTGGIPLFGSVCSQNYDGPVAAVPHLHGGEVPPEIDGSPDSWFTSDGNHHGHKYYSMTGAPANGARYRYPNKQEAAPAWFHDHTLGATRLNVYAGLAGAYLIDDPNLGLPANFPPPNEIIPIVIQDRMFDTDGQLFFPADSAGGALASPNPEHPYWVPEFIGDTILVNGKAWPYLEVEPRRYTFLFLNGSNARSYAMSLYYKPGLSRVRNPPFVPLWVVGSDGGYLDYAVPFTASVWHAAELVMMPGERYLVTIDFSTVGAGRTATLLNSANAPYPGGDPVDSDTTGQIMQFHVTQCFSGNCGTSDPSWEPDSTTELRSQHPLVRLVDPNIGVLAPGVTPSVTRELTLNEVIADPQTAIDPVTGVLTDYPGGPLEILVNNTKWSGESTRTYGDFTPIMVNGVTTGFTEKPVEGSTELWEIVNLTADAHPIHLHLVQFQVLDRQLFDVAAYSADYDASFPDGVYQPAFGPPLDYRAVKNSLSGGKEGGNPDVTPYLDPIWRDAPRLEEAGWKDTVMAPPGTVTRLVVRWAPTDLPVDAAQNQLFYPFDPSGSDGFNYVWHCHIIDHEDNEMMRPDTVLLNPTAPVPGSRPLVKGIDY